MRDRCSVTAMILSVMTTIIISDSTSYTMVGCHSCVASDMNVKYPNKSESDSLDEIYETGTDKSVTVIMFQHC
jgi:hypothetical protein